jgi:hypothetical protein
MSGTGWAAAQKDSALAELADREGEHEKIRRVFEKTGRLTRM